MDIERRRGRLAAPERWQQWHRTRWEAGRNGRHNERHALVGDAARQHGRYKRTTSDVPKPSMPHPPNIPSRLPTEYVDGDAFRVQVDDRVYPQCTHQDRSANFNTVGADTMGVSKRDEDARERSKNLLNVSEHERKRLEQGGRNPT